MEAIEDIIKRVPPELSPMTFFVTLTLPPKMYKYASITQWEITSGVISDIFMQWGGIIVVPELTHDANIHYHGIIKFHDVVKKCQFIDKCKRNRDIGYIKVTKNPLIKLEEWQRAIYYLLKDLPDTHKVLSQSRMQYRIVYTKHDIGPFVEEVLKKEHPPMDTTQLDRFLENVKESGRFTISEDGKRTLRLII